MGVFKNLFQGTGNNDKNPFYVRATMIMLGLVLFFYIMLILRDVLVPLCFALLISILLNPLVNRLMQLGIHKISAISLALLVAIIGITIIFVFLTSQAGQFIEMAPEFQDRASKILDIIQKWIRNTFNVPIYKQDEVIANTMNNSQDFVAKALGSIFSFLAATILLPIYTFLILYYKPLFLNFIYEVFEDKYENRVADVLQETKGAIQAYIVGLLIETAIVAGLNSAALLLLGVEYAILLGIIGGILNLIPYVGGLVAIALPVGMSMVTSDGNYTTPLLIIAAYSVIQFLDNNVLVPRIVSSKVDVNAFVTIVIVLLGAAIWGVPGMFLSVPFIAVCKIIFDRIPQLQPWGKLLGVTIGEPPPPREVVSKIDEEAME
ncbi:AI-2E family transporter [Haoranjiania flava]|uniref:AI-2E family transporter n=1 Tax=Haoranjiania flava TaxID=1856322 RepID=A0AAE3LK13_9BACT|nr:AI-2E family transporter [Haoranjiania flava]MCU7694347.1 AI-2E family transporter [Haoranjiania flava]